MFLQFPDQVDPVLAACKFTDAAAAEQVDAPVHEAAGQLVGIVALDRMPVEGRRRGIGNVTQRHDAHGQPPVVEEIAQRGIGHALRAHRDMAVIVAFARGQGAAAGSRVGREGIQRIVLLQADIFHLQGRQPLVGIESRHDLRQPHAVADQVDHVANPSPAPVVAVSRGVDVDALGELQLVVLEAPEIARGLVQALGARHAFGGRAALADLEILVAEIIEERGAHLGMVGIEVVDTHIIKGIVNRRPFGGAPETHGFSPGMCAVDDRLQFRTLGRDDRALAVPLRIVAEIGAYQGDALQLRGRIVGIPHPVETDIGGIFAEIGRCRDTPRDDDPHGLGVHRRVEHLGIAAQQCRNGL